MVAQSQQVEWLSLVETSGPFLTVAVLEQAFPQGLESIETPRRQKLRSAYSEWREAVDEEDELLPQLHDAWVNLVLTELLEFDEESATRRSSWVGGAPSISSPDGMADYAPTWIIHAPGSTEPRAFTAVTRPDADLESAAQSDGWIASEVERMTLLCREHGVRVGIVTNGESWVLINAPTDAPSGKAIWHSRFWFQEPATLKAFQSLLGVRRCFGPTDQSLEALLDQSLKHQEEVTDTLGEQVRRATEVLIQALDKADQDRNRELLHDVPPSLLYEASLTVMMRLVFVLCAEERGLFLLGDPVYDQNLAVSTLRGKLAEEADQLGDEVLERRYDAWARLLSVFRAVYAGIEHEDLRLPAMGGSLFDPDRYSFLEGRALGTSWLDTTSQPLPIDNRTVLLLLNSLQVLEQSRGALALSYRALDVEQIGHVYEGLLDHTVVRVPDTTLGLKGSSKNRYPTLSLASLESLVLEGQDALVAKVVEATGRTKASIRKEFTRPPSDAALAAVLNSANGDRVLSDRIKPFANLVRSDAWGEPIIYRAKSFMVTVGTERRESGTHYTPRSLTEQIVDVALEPLAYAGPAEGGPRDQWILNSPEAILDLKVCDPAMGSGAFLVQACRYLAERLVEAWAVAEASGRFVNAHGDVVDALGTSDPLPSQADERIITARRLVAERCLYGADINPLAVELAKLSLWLVTLAQDKPFGFLDHNLRVGDSLLGVHNLSQVRQLRLTPTGGEQQTELFGRSVENVVEEVITLRQKLRAIVTHDISDTYAMAALDSQARVQLTAVDLIADCLVGEGLESAGNAKAQKDAEAALRTNAEFFIRGEVYYDQVIHRRVNYLMTDGLPTRARSRQPFHWALEFPEVFQDGGFHAILGNPPFLGNRLWKSSFGNKMQAQVRQVLGTAPGKIDLCIAFHRRAVDLLRPGGMYGLVARDNVTEGSAIKVGLGAILKSGDIIWARKSVRWPGAASVVVSLIAFFKGAWAGTRHLDGEEVGYIGPRLEDASRDDWQPKKLRAAPDAFAGVDNSQGLAFVLADGDPWLERLNSEAKTLMRPYISGNDITDHALQRVKRWALDIGDRDLADIATNWPIAFEFLTEVVKPTRTAEKLRSYKGLVDRWWQFWNHRAEGMHAVRKHDSFIAFPKVAKYPFSMLAPSDWVYTNKVALLSPVRSDMYAICISSFFRRWLYAFSVRSFGANSKTIQLSISEAVSTFALPELNVSYAGEQAANRFNQAVMHWSSTSGEGLTGFLNLLNDPACADEAILGARTLLEQVDESVSAAYGWGDLDVSFDFRPYVASTENDPWRWAVSDETNTELMRRLTTLNHERFEAEEAAKDQRKRRRPRKTSDRDDQQSIFGDDMKIKQ